MYITITWNQESSYMVNAKKNICLMDVATIAAKELKKTRYTNRLDESEEINACSIEVEVKDD